MHLNTGPWFLCSQKSTKKCKFFWGTAIFLVVLVSGAACTVNYFFLGKSDELSCDKLVFHDVVYYGDIIKGGEFTRCQLNASLYSEEANLNATVKAFSHDCDKLKVNHCKVEVNSSNSTTNVTSFSVYDSRTNSSYFANGMKGNIEVKTSTLTKANISICVFTDVKDYDTFLNSTSANATKILTNNSGCTTLEVNNGTKAENITYNNAKTSYYFIGIRVMLGNIDHLWYKFTTERDYYEIGDFKDDIQCELRNRFSKCSNISLPYSKTCVMLYVVPGNKQTIFHPLTLHGVENTQRVNHNKKLYILTYVGVFLAFLFLIIIIVGLLLCYLLAKYKLYAGIIIAIVIITTFLVLSIPYIIIIIVIILLH